MTERWRAGSGGLVFALAASVLACGGGDAQPLPPPPFVSAAASAGIGAAAPFAGNGGAAADGAAAIDLRAIFDGQCATATARAELVPSNLLFVIDRSSSMACNPPPTTDSALCETNSTRQDFASPSKWEIVRTALRNAMLALPDTTFAGLTYFSNDDACGVHSLPSVEIARLERAQRSAIDASLSNVEPGGATPLVGAMVLAYRHLHGAALAGTLRGNKFAVVLTDGEQSDSCSDPSRCSGAAQCTDQLISSEVPKAAGAGVGIKTFVIGAPGSEPARRVLSQIALLGGTSLPGCSVEQGTCHFDMTRRPEFGPALAEALATIVGRTQSCDLDVPRGAGADPSLVNVVYTPGSAQAPVLVLKDDRLGCDSGANGWQYADAGRRIRLCGQACDRVRRDAAARVDVVFGCRVRVPE